MREVDVLFLCSGNFYRSRFAEELWNARAPARRAASAGLIERCWTRNAGAISPHAVRALAARGIDVRDPRPPRDVTEADLAAARLVIAVKESEHRPMVAARFPGWLDRIVYWAIDDVDVAPPQVALAELERRVMDLMGRS